VIDILARLNWGAVVLAAAVYYVLGAAWFTPLFGRAWDRAIGYDRSATQGKFGLDYYVVPLASAVCVSGAIGFILTVSSVSDMGSSLLIGLALGFLVALPLSINNALTPHTPRPYVLGLITGGYHLVGIVGATAIIAAFHA
jgi:hypothetical protein